MGIVFTSCKSGSSGDVSAIDSSVVPASSNLQVKANDTTVPVAINPQQNGMPVTLNGTSSNSILPAGTIPVTTAPVTATAATSTTAPGMNPPHGQPGHRCDINVGAPLNSKPNPTAAPQPVQASITQPNQATTQTAQTTVTPTPTTTAPGMNPPHGQPNHRCDIAVGAPLNSKPAATPSVTQTPVQQAAQPNVIPAGTTTFTPAGMNPPHGQPNHRCDIAVGAPLNSAPAVKKDTVAHN